jgi:hypothetical protein
MSELSHNFLVDREIPAEAAAPGVPALLAMSGELSSRAPTLRSRADEPRARERSLPMVGARSESNKLHSARSGQAWTPGNRPLTPIDLVVFAGLFLTAAFFYPAMAWLLLDGQQFIIGAESF